MTSLNITNRQDAVIYVQEIEREIADGHIHTDANPTLVAAAVLLDIHAVTPLLTVCYTLDEMVCEGIITSAERAMLCDEMLTINSLIHATTH